MSPVIDPSSVAHRTRCVTTKLGHVVRCPNCRFTTFEGFEFDGRRDPLGNGVLLVNPDDEQEIAELIGALLDMTELVERPCLQCA